MATQSNRRRMVARSAGALAAGVALAGREVQTAAAHHSYPAIYDTDQRVTVTGVVQLVQFTNPHVHIIIESPLDDGSAGAAVPAEPAVQGAEGATQSAEGAEPVGGSETTFQAAPEPAATLWLLDMPAPNQALNLGLSPETLAVGTPLTVEAWPSRTAGSHDLAPVRLTLDALGRAIQIRR